MDIEKWQILERRDTYIYMDSKKYAELEQN